MLDYLERFKQRTIYLDLPEIDEENVGHEITDRNLINKLFEENITANAAENEANNMPHGPNPDDENEHNIPHEGAADREADNEPPYPDDENVQEYFGSEFIQSFIAQPYFVEMIRTKHNLSIIRYHKGNVNWK